MQLAYQQGQATYTNTTTHTPHTNHTIPSTSSHTSSVLYVADYTLFVKNTLEMTEKQLSTRKKTNEANTTSNINPSTTTATKRKKSTPTTATTTNTVDNSNNSIDVLPTINSESLPPTHTHTQPLLIGADLLSIPRIGTKAVAALLAYIGSTTGRRIVEELLAEVTVRPYTTTTTTGITTGIGKVQQQQQQQVNELLTKGMISDTMTSDNIEMINGIQSNNDNNDNNNNNDNNDDDGTNEVISDITIITTDINAIDTNDIDTISNSTPSPSTSTNDGDNSISTSTGTSSTKSKSRNSSINRSIVSKSYLPLHKEVVVFTGKFSSMTRSGAGAVSETLGTR